MRALPLLALLLVLAILATPRAPLRAGPAAGYVGAEACLRCHGAEHARWSLSSHARTFEPVTEANVPPEAWRGGRVEHPPLWTEFRRTEGALIARTPGPDGAPTDYPMTHVVGRMRVRMYVATLPDGRQQVLPGMLEVPTGTWFDYTHLIFGAGGTDWDTPPVVRPGDPSFWTGPVRSWDANCASCHTSGYRPTPRPPGGEGPRYHARALGVDCESCHGPGAAHLAFRETAASGRDPILDFGALSRERALMACLRCHMEAEDVEPGFEVGADVLEFRTPTLLTDPERVDPYARPVELIYDGVPFLASRCATEGALTCLTCHDPHGSEHPSQLRRPPTDDTTCTTCHTEIGQDPRAHTHHDPAGAGGRCVACHMPWLTIERGHGVVADHSISTPAFDLAGDRLAANACVQCHADQDGRKEADLRAAFAAWWPEARPRPAWGPVLGAARQDPAGPLEPLKALARAAGAPSVARASAVDLLARRAKEAAFELLALARDPDSLVRRRAVAALSGLVGEAADRALLGALDDPSAPVRSAAARAALEGWSRVQANRPLLLALLPRLEQEAHDQPLDDLRWFRLAAARTLAGDIPGAIAAYETQLGLDPFAEASRRALETLRARPDARR